MDLSGLDPLWRRSRAGDLRARDELVTGYMWLARKIAHEKRVPDSVERDDVVSWAYQGLLDAVNRFDIEKSDGSLHKHFMAYASQRIRGAILDGLKSPTTSWASRLTWRKIRDQRAAEDQLSQDLGRHVSQAELAEHLQVEVSDLVYLRQQVPVGAIMLDEDHGLEVIPGADRPDEEADLITISERLAAHMAALPADQHEVVTALYFRRLGLGEAAAALGLPASRVRKLRAEAVATLLESLQRD